MLKNKVQSGGAVLSAFFLLLTLISAILGDPCRCWVDRICLSSARRVLMTWYDPGPTVLP